MKKNVIDKRIDFVCVITVDGANPNGDPLSKNTPRTDYAGRGEISGVCIKHKLRNRMALTAGDEPGNAILMVPASSPTRYESIQAKLEDTMVQFHGETVALADVLKRKDVTVSEKSAALCEAFRDVRMFGWVAGSNASADDSGKTVGITGPATICDAKSLEPINLVTQQITKNIRSEQNKRDGAGTDTMGTVVKVSEAAYVFRGGISAYEAERTGLTWDDAEALKQAILDMFADDTSAARPVGSMSVQKLYWFVQDTKLGEVPPAVVHGSVKVEPSDKAPFFTASLDKSVLKSTAVEELGI